MTVVGMQFNKINVEKNKPAKGKVSVNNNVSIKNVEKTQLAFGTSKQDALNFAFEFVASYEPRIATITLEGNLTYFDKQDAIKKLYEVWQKDKKVSPEVMTPILNSILNKCNVEALLLSREINLPPPIPLPRVKTQKK